MEKLQNLIDRDKLAAYHDELMQDVVNEKVNKAASLTYADIVALRDDGELIPGQFYRITDYVTTTVQAETQSAGHQFDVIVCAASNGTLNEEAYAAPHEGDTYFQNARLEAWELKYCLDNDTSRFAWADSQNGKGVIYRMKDEWNNDLPFDFKNIQFKRYKITATSKKIDTEEVLASLKNTYLGFRSVALSGTGSLYPQGCTMSTTDTVWRFTFDNNGTDLSLTPAHRGNCHGNTIAAYRPQEGSNRSRQWLNNIAFLNTSATSNCYGNHFKERCHSMSFGNGCYSNTFGQYCYSNTFGQNCYFNTFGQGCYFNTFGQYCQSNTFGQNCYFNTFGQYCYSNTLGQGCGSNTFGQYACLYEFSNPDCIIGFRALTTSYTDVRDSDGNFVERVYALVNLGAQRSVKVQIVESYWDEETEEDMEETIVNATVQLAANQTLTYISAIDEGYPMKDYKCQFTEQGRTVTFAPYF